MTAPPRRQKRARVRGQNLVELALVLPFFFVVVFAIIEVGRAWQTYEGAKMAALDAAYTASIFQDANIGRNQLQSRLDSARLTFTSFNVQPVGSVGYQSTVTVVFQPISGGLTIPTLSGPITIIPGQFPITYQNVQYYSVY